MYNCQKITGIVANAEDTARTATPPRQHRRGCLGECTTSTMQFRFAHDDAWVVSLFASFEKKEREN